MPILHEKVVWLPDTFMANDDKRAIAERVPSRAELQLPENGFVFCSFNQSYKIEPTDVRRLDAAATAVDGSVLWLKDNDPMAPPIFAAKRSAAASRRSVWSSRRVPGVADHLARQRQADLFLDTLHYNAHTTAADALWAGLPVLTCRAEHSPAGRGKPASRRRASRTGDASLADYEALALKLAREPRWSRRRKPSSPTTATPHAL